MEHLINNLPNGGAVVAILLCTWFFLARQREGDATLVSIVGLFTHELEESRKAYLEQIKELTQKPRPR